MKKQVFAILSLLIMMLPLSLIATPQSRMAEFNINGVTVLMPVKVEEAPDSVPAELKEQFNAWDKEYREDFYKRQFDIRKLAPEEQSVEDKDIDTSAIFMELVRRQPGRR